MKKLLLVIGAALALASCKSKPATITGTPDTLIETSLNGITPAIADSMETYFINHPDSSPKNTQVWFSKVYLDSLFSLLAEDSLKGEVKPDGIRIYFAATPPTDGVPLHSNTKIILVSTYFSGNNVNNGDTIKVHDDYYKHFSKAGLLQLPDSLLNGKVSHYTNDKYGALLYDTCNCDSPFVSSDPHDIKPSEAEKLVKRFPGQPYNSKSEWFDLKMLKHFKDKIDQSGNGIRIYFARGLDKADNKIKTRFVMVATKKIVNPNNTSSFLDIDYFSNKTNGNIALPNSSKTNVAPNPGENGEICPPRCL